MGLSSSQSRSERVFSIWLITGLFLYVTGFYLSPTSKGQYLTLYIGMILPALYFSFWRFRDYFLRPNNALLWVFAAVLLLYLPSMWVSGAILDTLRKNLKHVIFVLSFAIAIRHGYLHYPSLMASTLSAFHIQHRGACLLLHCTGESRHHPWRKYWHRQSGGKPQ